MKQGDLIEYNWHDGWKIGIVIRKSQFYGWLIYFFTTNKFDHLAETALTTIQQLTEEK